MDNEGYDMLTPYKKIALLISDRENFRLSEVMICILLSEMARVIKKKSSKGIVGLSGTTNQLHIIHIYKVFYSILVGYTLFLRERRTFPKINTFWIVKHTNLKESNNICSQTTMELKQKSRMKDSKKILQTLGDQLFSMKKSQEKCKNICIKWKPAVNLLKFVEFSESIIWQEIYSI